MALTEQLTVKSYGASVWARHLVEDADKGGFARTIWTQQTKNLTFRNLQRDVVEHQLALIGFTDLRYFNHDLKLRKI
jgi:hypothetical protein